MRFSTIFAFILLVFFGFVLFSEKEKIKPLVSSLPSSFAKQKLPDEFMPELLVVELEFSNEIKKLQVGKYEITIGQWKYCYAEGGCSFLPRLKLNQDDLHPITNINFLDALEYIAWISKRSGNKYRLPTEKEWSLFANLNKEQTKKKLFDDPRMAWAADYINYQKQNKITQEAGAFGENQFGLFDIKGNVWEWTSTCYGSENVGQTTMINCGAHIVQGEHRGAIIDFVRNPLAGGCSIGFTPSNLGFRIVREL